jgi:hypothetical protein
LHGMVAVLPLLPDTFFLCSHCVRCTPDAIPLCNSACTQANTRPLLRAPDD